MVFVGSDEVMESKENLPPDAIREIRDHSCSEPVPTDQHRRRREDPDVTVVVGDREFLHYSQVLCLASDYFDVALNIGMKEAETMRIEMAGDDPSEWELFASFLEPFSQAKVTTSNVVTLIPWFHKFGVTSMLKQCDRIYVDMAVSQPFQRKCWNRDGHLTLPNVGELQKKLRNVLNAYAFSTMYDLTITKERTAKALRRQIACGPEIFDRSCVALLVTVLQQEETRKGLWSVVKEYLPVELQNDDPQSLVSNKLFPFMLHTWMQNTDESPEPGMFAA